MVNNEHITYIDYPLDMDEIKKILNEIKHLAKPYIPFDKERYGSVLNEWKRVNNYRNDYINKVLNDFEIEGTPRFYWQDPFYYLEPHTDRGSHASLNFLISGGSAPVTFENVNYYYSQALINTDLIHSVKNGPEERILFKISIHNETYNDLAKRIKYKVKI